MSCPTLVSPPWAPWGFQTIPPGQTVALSLSGGPVPTGATIVFTQLSVQGAPGVAVYPTYPTGDASDPVRAQASGIWNDTLGFCPIWSDFTIRIKNSDAANTATVYVRALGYA